ncbi:hypothetical protein Ct61P_13776 [Colletotrichum tofieldiae]|nr:hypothetical protein Ct61P_13776 [Colletotrichum tofieldiae]
MSLGLHRPGVCLILWGHELGFLCQLELEIGGRIVCQTNSSWDYLGGPATSSELYNGEIFDTTLSDAVWSSATVGAVTGSSEPFADIRKVNELPFLKAEVFALDVAPAGKIMEIKPERIITTPSGKKVLDFGHNLVGWLRIETNTKGSGESLIKHAEVMENGQLGTRSLRTAKVQVAVRLGGETKGYGPKFTFFGYRIQVRSLSIAVADQDKPPTPSLHLADTFSYAEITEHDSLQLSDFTAIVVSSLLCRTGSFECSHGLINKLHENAVWLIRGNFVSLPTRCPQRDERLGWTGYLQVFAPMANVLFDTSAFLGHWLRVLEADQRDIGGVVPNVVPSIPIPPRHPEKRPMAVWADCAILASLGFYNTFGDIKHFPAHWEIMRLWLDKGG